MPSYLGRSFESRRLRIVAAVVAAVPMLLVLSAELRIGAGVAGHLIALNPNLIVCVLALSVAITTAAAVSGRSRGPVSHSRSRSFWLCSASRRRLA